MLKRLVILLMVTLVLFGCAGRKTAPANVEKNPIVSPSESTVQLSLEPSDSGVLFKYQSVRRTDDSVYLRCWDPAIWPDRPPEGPELEHPGTVFVKLLFGDDGDKEYLFAFKERVADTMSRFGTLPWSWVRLDKGAEEIGKIRCSAIIKRKLTPDAWGPEKEIPIAWLDADLPLSKLVTSQKFQDR